MDPPPPVAKPRTCYKRNVPGSSLSLDSKLQSESRTGDEAPPLPDGGVNFPSLTSLTDIIANNIPSLAGFATSIGGSTPPVPSAPPPVDSMANNVTANMPSLTGAANVVANPTNVNAASNPTPVAASATDAVNLDSIFSSLAKIPGLEGIVSQVANPADSSSTLSNGPSAPPTSLHTIANGDTHADLEALSNLMKSGLQQRSEGTSTPAEEGATPRTGEKPYVSALASWASQEEVGTDSSNEDEDPGASNEAASANTPTPKVDPAPSPNSNATNLPLSPSDRLMPSRPAPPPPRPSGQPGKPVKQKKPRAATIRVSRKTKGSRTPPPQSAVVRSSWLDVWKGFRHSVMWATLDGQLMSLWKKRTDRFSELLFHLSSVTSVKKLDRCRFSVYFKKKHYDFMAFSNEVQEGWVSSLLASRGLPSPAPPKHHGQITIKDPRSRAYAAVWGHDLWIYQNKDGFQLGIASFLVPMNVASVKQTGKHSFMLITPYRSFSLSVDSSKDLSVWLECLSSSISSALSCSQVAMRLWENPDNKVCGDCGSANPEWASVNLLLVICQACAGQHRALGSNLSKVRSLKMDSKVWTEPLIQLFVAHGNRLANQVWAPVVPAAEQLCPESSDEERSKFIQDKYSRGRYRRVHALATSPALMDQRLRQVVCGDDVEETMSLICSGAKVCQRDPQSPAPIHLAEKANQALQTELLRLNEYTETPAYQPQSANRRPESTPSGEEEELHGKLEDDRFLFSLENDSAACDVLDLREVLSVFLKHGDANEFEIVTLNDQLICSADDAEALSTHLVHILKVILPRGVSYAEVGGASAASKVSVVEVGGASSRSEAWLLLWEDGVSVYPVHAHTLQPLILELSKLSRHEHDPAHNIITMATAERCVSLRFEEQLSCQSWFNHLQRALTNERAAPQPPATNHSTAPCLYPRLSVSSRGSVPLAIQRCISHVTAHGLKVEGVYRRCGIAPKVARLVEALMTSPNSAPLESDEQGVLDAGSALKQYVRQQEQLIPQTEQPQWLQAAGVVDERSRFAAYRQLLRRLPDDNRATLNALIGHFYMVQVFSQVNKMSAHNLAVVLVPTLFETLDQSLLRLTREFIIHHTLLFLTPGGGEEEEEKEEEVTVF